MSFYPFELKTWKPGKEDRWEFKGLASVFNVVDRVKDKAMPGCYKRSIDHHGGHFPLMVMHGHPQYGGSIVGGAILSESRDGLETDGYLLKSLSTAKDAKVLMEAGILNAMSIAQKAIKVYWDHGVQCIEEAIIGEVTLAPRSLAINQSTMAVLKAGFAISSINYPLRSDGDFEKICSWWGVENSIKVFGGKLKNSENFDLKSLEFCGDEWTHERALSWIANNSDFRAWCVLQKISGSMKMHVGSADLA